MLDPFPFLSANNHERTSPETYEYNCIAWAAGENDRWWWPSPGGLGYWPPGVSRTVVLQSFFDAFAILGYEVCESGELEDNYQKVAIYVDNNGAPTHMARQLDDGTWTSKLGQAVDINHFTLDALHGPEYGTVCAFMRRPL